MLTVLVSVGTITLEKSVDVEVEAIKVNYLVYNLFTYIIRNFIKV